MEEVVGYLFNLEVTFTEPKVGLVTDGSGDAVDVAGLGISAKGLEKKSDAALTYSAPDEQGAVSKKSSKPNGAQRDSASGGAPTGGTRGPGRNAKCPCGSGKKYKLCHGKPDGK